MRFVYLDEAGTSIPEPVALAAGVLVNADKQWRPVERHLSKMIADAPIPNEARPGFVFHATELFSGGENFPRQIIPTEQRWRLLDELVAIPSTFGLPVVVGFFRKDAIGTVPNPRVPDATAHTFAYALCATAADTFMRNRAPDEVATVVAEDTPRSKQSIKAIQALLQDAGRVERELPAFMHEELPLTHIKDTVHFASKRESMMLMIADACAFTLRHHLSRGRECERFLANLFGGKKIPVALAEMLASPGGHQCFTWEA